MKITAKFYASILAACASIAAARVVNATRQDLHFHLGPIEIVPQPDGVVSIEQPISTAHAAMPPRNTNITMIDKNSYRKLRMARCCKDPACACIQLGRKELGQTHFSCTEIEHAYRANAKLCQLKPVGVHGVHDGKHIDTTVGSYEERVKNNKDFLRTVLEHSNLVSLLHNRTVNHSHHFAWNLAITFVSHFRYQHQSVHNGTFDWSAKLHSGVPVHHNASALPHSDLIKMVWNTMKATAAKINGTNIHEDSKPTQLNSVSTKTFVSPGGVFEGQVAALNALAPAWAEDDKSDALNLTHLFSSAEVAILQDATPDAVGITALQMIF